MKIQVSFSLEIPDGNADNLARLQGAAYAGALRAISNILQNSGIKVWKNSFDTKALAEKEMAAANYRPVDYGYPIKVARAEKLKVGK